FTADGFRESLSIAFASRESQRLVFPTFTPRGRFRPGTGWGPSASGDPSERPSDTAARTSIFTEDLSYVRRPAGMSKRRACPDRPTCPKAPHHAELNETGYPAMLNGPICKFSPGKPISL